MLSVPSKFTTFPDFLKFLIPALNGTVGFWATVSLNIPDFTRFARNQREQIIGQALALPTTMTLYAFVGIVVTSATVVIYGTAIWDPVQLLSRFHSPVAVVISLVAILLATLNVNIGANVVSPANDFSNLWPRGISFRTGGSHHLLHGHRHDAVETALELPDIHPRMARRLRGVSRSGGGHHDLRLFCDSSASAGGGRSVSARWDLRICSADSTGVRSSRWSLGAARLWLDWRFPRLGSLYDYSWFVGFAISFVSYYAMMRTQRHSRAHSASVERSSAPLTTSRRFEEWRAGPRAIDSPAFCSSSPHIR